MQNMTTPSDRNPVTILQKLIRFDTTNPPGNERECITWVNNLLKDSGIQTQTFAKTPERPNLIARLPGRGEAAPLLLYGHVDVVTTENQQWQHPPFEAEEADGFIWGRGAIDMKSGVAMMLAALLRAKAEGLDLPGDVVFAAVSDEEGGGEFGARFLVEEHPEHFKDIHYAFGEFGGFTMTIANKRFYPIMVAEKQICWMKATLRGPGGHGSMPVRGGAMARLAEFLKRLDEHNLPVHVTPVAQQMIGAIAGNLGGVKGMLLGQLINPTMTDFMLKLLGDSGRTFGPLLHNTASPTMLQGSSKINVIPGEVSVGIDGRLLPGFGPDEMLAEMHQLTGPEVDIEIARYEEGPAEPDMGLFDTLAGVLREADPEAIPIPLLLSGVTDGRFFSKLGIQTYGFTPLRLNADFNFMGCVHAANERVPVEAVEFGAEAIYQALKRLG
jgi:acetylornithine deacetylase/succinyl-diaminopimelate desuccinylase-like protein